MTNLINGLTEQSAALPDFETLSAYLHKQYLHKMTNQLLEQLAAGNMKFSDVLAYIESMYQHIPTGFRNGNHYNAATDNQGSARVLFFAKLHNLNKEQTLSLFAEHYQQVLETPDAENHQNIRSFMQQGWEGVHFEGEALLPDKQEP